MEKRAQIYISQRNGNLHINLAGQFNPDTAEKLITIMTQNYKGKGNIFIHTGKVTVVSQNSRYVFSKLLGLSGLPDDNIYLMGERGLEISHDLGKVIVHKKKTHGHGGCGKCKNCTCHTRKAA